MTDASLGQDDRVLQFGLIVTGKGEEAFLPRVFRSISTAKGCSFEVIKRIGQRSPRTSKERIQRMLGSGKLIPQKDETDISLPARTYLSSEGRFVILIDDLEPRRRETIQKVFDRYRSALDAMLRPDQIHRASVHFFVTMLEAYYFADAQAVNQVLGVRIEDHEGDVEEIRNPKSKLKGLYPGFHEIKHGRRIVDELRMDHVLSRKETCAALRTMFAWICKALGEPESETWRLLDGRRNAVTATQIHTLPPPEWDARSHGVDPFS